MLVNWTNRHFLPPKRSLQKPCISFIWRRVLHMTNSTYNPQGEKDPGFWAQSKDSEGEDCEYVHMLQPPTHTSLGPVSPDSLMLSAKQTLVPCFFTGGICSVCGLKGVWESGKLGCCQLVLLASLLCLYTEGSIIKCKASCEKVTFHCHRLGERYHLYLNRIFNWWKVVPGPFITLMHLGSITLVVNHQKV